MMIGMCVISEPMKKLKSIVFIAGVLLLILAVTIGYLSIKNLSGVRSADSYEDNGVYTFSPYQVLPVQVKNTGASGRDRRMNPTKTVYMVYYRTTDGSGYQWSERAITRELGQKTVEEGVSVTRRVLSIPNDSTYITVEPEQTAESYTAELRQKYMIALCLSAGYIVLYLLIWYAIWYKKRKGLFNKNTRKVEVLTTFNFAPKFKFDEERNQYVTELDGVEFVCDELQDDYKKEAQKLSKLYFEKLPGMIDFMLPELEEIYGEIDKDKLPELLGKPTINLSTFQIMYLEQTLDDSHVIEFEYADDFKEFFYFSIDG